MRLGAALGVVVVVVVVVTATACGDLKHADDDDPTSGVDGGSADASAGSADGSPGNGEAGPSDGGPGDGPAGDAASGSFGPGPHGSLPSGYCCTSDAECRYRHCVDTGAGGKMCLDECSRDLFCTRPDLAFTCEVTGSPRLCKPSAGFACLPSSTFQRGKRPIGACCNAAAAPNNDGTAGSECEGNQCASVSNAPLVCTHRCASQADCIGGFACILFGTSKACVPVSSAYTCE
ncbi:MAG: hypothetical protein JST00_36560 [Deltaproteobacteria bacterium]|nr:hypothetical protein [Deltaproteobacteria bacterium]